MSHIDAKTDVRKIAKDIKQLYPDLLQISNVKIWYGSSFGQHDSTITQKLILTFTQHLDINITTFKENIQDIIQHNTIIQCRICKAQSGSLLIIPHYYNCQYNNPVQIYHVGFMDNVSSF